MKKHNEGYALPFVLVVLIVMCLIVVGIMDFSLRNLKSQQNTILRMEAKYEAAGEIEKIVAAVENNVIGASFDSSEKLLFCIVNKNLRVAAASGDIWIIAELQPKNANGDITTTFGTNGNSKTLTINGNDTKVIEYVKYQLVDENAAMEFMRGVG